MCPQDEINSTLCSPASISLQMPAVSFLPPSIPPSLSLALGQLAFLRGLCISFCPRKRLPPSLSLVPPSSFCQMVIRASLQLRLRNLMTKLAGRFAIASSFSGMTRAHSYLHAGRLCRLFKPRLASPRREESFGAELRPNHRDPQAAR